jgi:hypothetical protein
MDIRRSLLRAIALTGGSSRGFKFVSQKKMRTVSHANSVLPLDDDVDRLRRAQLDRRDKT